MQEPGQPGDAGVDFRRQARAIWPLKRLLGPGSPLGVRQRGRPAVPAVPSCPERGSGGSEPPSGSAAERGDPTARGEGPGTA